jgi:hypothetical protein
MSNFYNDKERGSFQEKFENFEPEPPSDMWSRISSDLDPVDNRKSKSWMFIAAVIAGILIGSTLTIFYFNSNSVLVTEKQVEKVYQENYGTWEKQIPEILNEVEIPPVEQIINPSNTQSSPKNIKVIVLAENEKVLPEIEQPEMDEEIAIVIPETGKNDKINILAEMQEVEIIPIKKSRLTFGFHVSPAFNYRILTANTSQTEYLAEFRNFVENGILAYGTGVFAEYSLNKKMSIRAGLGWRTAGENGDIFSVWRSSTTNPSLDYVSVESNFSAITKEDLNLTGTSDIKTFKNRYRYISLPVTFQYNLNKFYLGTGFSTSILVNANAVLPHVVDMVNSSDEASIRKFDHQFHILAGKEFLRNDKWSLAAEPNFSISVLPTVYYGQLSQRSNFSDQLNNSYSSTISTLKQYPFSGGISLIARRK